MSELLRQITANLKQKHPRLAQKAEDEATDLVDLLNSLYTKVKKAGKPEDLDHLFRLVKGLDLVDAVAFDATIGKEEDDEESTDLDELAEELEEAEEDLDKESDVSESDFFDKAEADESNEDDLVLDED